MAEKKSTTKKKAKVTISKARKAAQKKKKATPKKAKKEGQVPKKTKEPSVKPKEAAKPTLKKTLPAKQDLAYVEFEVPLEEITLGDHQPRSREGIHARGSLTQLRESIRDVGLLQPILVQQQEDGKYLLISGERRYTACKELGHSKIRAVLPSKRTIYAIEKNDKTLDELALFENLQRKNLTPIEEGRCFQKLLGVLELTQEKLAERLGLKQPYINERLGFLNLPSEVRELIEEKKITTGQARELVRLKKLPDDERAAAQIELAGQLLVEKLTLRKAKKLVDGLLGQTKKRTGEHLTRLGAKKAAYFISALTEKFDEIDLSEFQEGEEDQEKLQKLADNLPVLIKRLQGLKKEVAKLVV